MRVKSPLCLLILLTLAALPSWSAPAGAPSPAVPEVTLADILAPVPAQPTASLDLGLFFVPRPQEKIACSPSCLSYSECRTICDNCAFANCKTVFGCSNRVCDCSTCP